MGHAFVVLNPVAGDATSSVRRALDKHFPEAGWTFELYETTGDERIADVVKEALADDQKPVDMCVAAGGDGTVSGVAGGVAKTGIPMGVLPLGTGNTFAREMRIPLKIEAALMLLTGDHATAQIDAMAVGDGVYVLNVTVGISGLTMRDTARTQKQRFGRVAYVWTGLRKLFGYQPHWFHLTVDGNPTCALGTPPLRWSPQVELDDGRIDVCIIRARSMVDYVGVATAVLLRRQSEEPALLHIIATDRVEVDGDPELPVQGDGDLIGNPPVEIAVMPRAVEVVVPQEEKAQPGAYDDSRPSSAA